MHACMHPRDDAFVQVSPSIARSLWRLFCLLRPRGGEDRLAFSVLWEVTPQGQILSSSFHKTFIHSRAALTYAEAQNLIDDPTDK